MKMFSAMVMSIFVGSAFAQEYKITRFEASDYRSFSNEEIAHMLGENKHLLEHYQCNGRDEMNPFQVPLRINPLRNSLKIKASKTDDIYTYQQGHFFDENGGEVIHFSDSFLIKVSSALARFEKLASTSKMLRNLEESNFPLTIALGMNSFNPLVPGGKTWSGMKMAQAIAFLSTLRMSPGGVPFTDIGSGGKILWNPSLIVETIESDGVNRQLDTDIALAHEMYHAFDAIRGTLDMGIVQGEGYEFQSVLEYRAVYFENLVRAELGVKLRKFYGEVSEGQDPMSAPDLLDEQGQAIYIPSPCLN